MCDEADIDIPDVIIDRAHRIGNEYLDNSKNVKCKSIIVRFTAFRHRTRFYRAKKILKRVSRLNLTFFSIWVFFHEHSRFTGQHGRGRLFLSLLSITSTRLYISRAIIEGNSPLHIASSRTRTGNLWFPSANR